MKATQVWVKAITDNHSYECQAVFDLEKIIGYEVSSKDGKLESVHVFLSSGKDRLLESIAWDDGALEAFVTELDEHFFPSKPLGEIDNPPDKIDFYYC